MERKRKLDVGTENGSSQEPDTKQVRATVNPYTGVPYSQKYHAILDKRQGAVFRELLSLREAVPHSLPP